MLWYLTRDYEKGLVYDGTNLNDVLDGQDALKFKRENPDFQTFTIPNLYGKPYHFSFPAYKLTRADVISPNSGRKDITYSWYEKVIELSNLWYINDYTLWAHKALTDYFDIYVKVQTWGEELYTLLQKEHVQIQEELESDDPDVVSSAIKKANDIKHRQNGVEGEMILLKESIMGYEQSDPIIFKPKKNSPEKVIKIWQNYHFEFPQYNDFKADVLNNYTAALRYQMLNKALEERNSNPRYKLHQRTNLLQRWQTDALKRMARRTVILASRRSWKTIIVALEILKEMLAHNYKAATRPRSVIFISKDFDAVGQVMDYITSLINEFDWMKSMFNYNSTDHIFSFDTLDENWKRKTLAQCKFYSALWKMPAVGDAADAVFFDEAMLYPKSIFDKIYPIVMNEWARMLIVSTFYSPSDDWDRIYEWPIRLCNEYEKESSKIIDIDKHILTLRKEKERTWIIPDECAGLRYTIDDVEVIINKDQVKASLQDDPDRYMRELYCRATEANSVLNYKPYIAQVRYSDNPYPHYESGPLGPEATILKPKFKRIVTAYDPAQTSDISAFLACGYDESRNKVCIIKEWWLNFKDKSSFIPQADSIKAALKHLDMFNCPILKTMDSTHSAVVDVMWSQRVFFQYLYFWTWWDNVRKWARPSEERIPKKLMVEAAQTMFDNGLVEIRDQDCKQLIEQLSNFVEFKNEYTNTSKFKWARGHDDFVDCLLMCLWTFRSHLGLSHNKFQVDSFTEYAMQQQEDNDPHHLLSDPDNQPKMRYETVSNAFWY